MRLRNAAAAAVGAFVLVLTVPSSASAAVGQFQYTYAGPDGAPRTAVLQAPGSRKCITLPETADPAAASPAHSPRNGTDAFATVYTEPNCTGDSFTLHPRIGYGNEALKVRSVVFS
ncbi:hypothetical protein ACH41H_41250 [Streptomyces sp. NPDC020800]|uniref:hypothetical protein n=1 Tax=Streptomyces sp. NPDC020800 TaxID=3365092 RepID=UPI0037B4E2CB